MTDDELETIYMALLSHPHDAWRATNQMVYAIVRDAIATSRKMSSESVQNLFEDRAARIAKGI